MNKIYDTNQIILALGGNQGVMALFGITSAAVTAWRNTQQIPKARLRHLYAIRPELFSVKPFIDKPRPPSKRQRATSIKDDAG